MILSSTLLFTLAAVAILAVAAGVLYLILQWSMKDFLKDVDPLSGIADIKFAAELFPQTGRLPMSSALKGTFVRWHNPQYFWSGDEFWQTFQDAPRKWEARERYAGKNLNCGHYFALDRAGASAEGQFYGLDTTTHQLLTIEAEFDAVLDLTYEDHLVALGREAIANYEDIPDRSRLMELLSHLVGLEKGGNDFTDFVGWWAQRRGYDGILFFGARALNAYPNLIWQIHNGQDEDMTGPVAPMYFNEMRGRPDLKNLVIFSGAGLTRRIAGYQIHTGDRAANAFLNVQEADLDRRLEFNAAYQAERASSFYLQTPLRAGPMQPAQPASP